MEAIVRGELEQVEQLALSASRTGERRREEARQAAASHASVALTTLLHVGLITRSEEAEWRERLGGALGDPTRLQRRRFSVRIDGDGQPTAEERARSAYLVCRDLTLGRLAWLHHTAATESAIADALAAEASDPDRTRRACELGFADRGKEAVRPHEL